MHPLVDGPIDLVVTSPPYPMIEMWDRQFLALDPLNGAALSDCDGDRAFELMHAVLDEVCGCGSIVFTGSGPWQEVAWRECHRVLRPGGLAYINVGDAMRTIGGEFRLFSNHSRILQESSRLSFSMLPDILWRRQLSIPRTITTETEDRYCARQ